MMLLVLIGESPCLLGHNWLSKVQLDWSAVSKVVSTLKESLDVLLQQYQTVSDDFLGTITPYKATLHHNKGATSSFLKPVLYSLHE